MPVVWYVLLTFMLSMYVVLDGFDLGVGILHRLVTRSEDERRLVLRSIGPVWDGNEVWLVAAAGTLYFAFPTLYATSFSGFYLPLMMVLWLLMARGLAIELRNHVDSPVWKPIWDASFSVSSALLAIFLGAALGNVVRGVPIDADGRFFEPLWMDLLRLGPDSGILDWFTLLTGLTAFVALGVHGARWLTLKTEGPLQERARRLGRLAWGPLLALTALLTVATLQVQPQVSRQMAGHRWGWIFPALALGGLFGMRWLDARRSDGRAFAASCLYLAGMLSSAAFGLFPYVLPSNIDPAAGLTVHDAAAPDRGLRLGLVWWLPGMALVAGSFVYTYRRFAGKVSLADEEH